LFNKIKEIQNVKNSNLAWVRENAGLSQQAAADLIQVTRRTFNRWETGAVAIPKIKWNLFLLKVNTPESAIPKVKEWDGTERDEVILLMGKEWPGSSLYSSDWPEHLYEGLYKTLLTSPFAGETGMTEEKIHSKVTDMMASHDVRLAIANGVKEGLYVVTPEGRINLTEKGRAFNAGEDLIG